MDREFLWRLLRMATGPLGNLPQLAGPGARHGAWKKWKIFWKIFIPNFFGFHGIQFDSYFSGLKSPTSYCFLWTTTEVLVVIGIFFAWTLAYYLSTSKVRPKRIITFLHMGLLGSFLVNDFTFDFVCCLKPTCIFIDCKGFKRWPPEKRPPPRVAWQTFLLKRLGFHCWPRSVTQKSWPCRHIWTWVWFN